MTQQTDVSRLIASARAKQAEIVEAEREGLRRRYELACIFLEIVRAPRVGRRSATTLAAHALGIDPTTITRWACLAQWLPANEVEVLIATPPSGEPLTPAQLRDIGISRAQHRDMAVARLKQSST